MMAGGPCRHRHCAGARSRLGHESHHPRRAIGRALELAPIAGAVAVLLLGLYLTQQAISGTLRPLNRGPPVDELPDLGFELAGPAADVGEDGDGALEVLHRLVSPAGSPEQVGEVVLERGLAVAVALALTAQERLPDQGHRAIRLAAVGAHQGQRVERGDAEAGICGLGRCYHGLLEVRSGLAEVSPTAGEDAEDVLGPGDHRRCRARPPPAPGPPGPGRRHAPRHPADRRWRFGRRGSRTAGRHRREPRRRQRQRGSRPAPSRRASHGRARGRAR